MRRQAALQGLWGLANGADLYTGMGLALAHVAGARVRYRHGVYLVEGGRITHWLKRHPLGAMAAVCLGRVIFAQNQHLLHQHLRHEWTHVRQFMRWGLLFPLLYMLEMLYQRLRGRPPYLDNHYEREARAAERKTHFS